MHYENSPIQYIVLFSFAKKDDFGLKNKRIVFSVYVQNIDCGYTLDPSSNEYPQSMFWARYKKNCLQLYTPVSLHKSGVCKGAFISWTCFPYASE